jgi:hypothetical protein
MILFSTKRHLERGNSYDFHPNLEERKMKHPLFVPIAWFVYIFGVYGSIGLVKAEKEVNVRVMEVCMTLLQARPLLDRRLYNRHHQMFFPCWIWK